MGHLKFMLKIRNSPEPFDYNTGAVFSGKIDQQRLKRMNGDFIQPFKRALDKLQPFLEAKERLLVGIGGDSYYFPVVNIRCPLNNIKMSERDRVISPRANSNRH